MIAPNEVTLIGSSVAEVVANLEAIHGETTDRRHGQRGAALVTFADGAVFAIRGLSGKAAVRSILPPHPRPKVATLKPRKVNPRLAHLCIGVAA